MTQEDQDAIVGRVAREYINAARQVAILESELDKLRDLHQCLGRALYRPLLVRFDDAPNVQNPPAGFCPEEFRFTTKSIDGSRVRLLCESLLAAKAKEADLAEQKRKLGI
jgi:hypothetical protein